MRNLFDPATAKEMKERIGRLGPNSQRQWGRMTAAQALAHLSTGMEWAVGDSKPPRMLVGYLFGPIAKSQLLKDERPMSKNAPTAKALVVADARDLDRERERLCALIDRFCSGGSQKCTTHPHTFFGPLTPDEWSRLQYKHVDHHLRQFGV
jgi:Protein of unknown function (DUF1569)